MRRYLLIVAAVAIAYLIYQGLLWYARRQPEPDAANRTTSLAPVVAAVVGLLALLGGLIYMETGSGSPSDTYQPAQIIDGKIQPGVFDSGVFDKSE